MRESSMDELNTLSQDLSDIEAPENFEFSLGTEGSKQNVLEKLANRFPPEIKRAVEGIDGETQYAILVLLFDEQRLSFSQLQDYLDVHQQTLSNALKKLQRGGLIYKRNSNDLNDKYDSHYLVSEFGERFVDCLFQSLESRRTSYLTSEKFVEDTKIQGMQFQPYASVEVKSQNKDRIESAEMRTVEETFV